MMSQLLVILAFPLGFALSASPSAEECASLLRQEANAVEVRERAGVAVCATTVEGSRIELEAIAQETGWRRGRVWRDGEEVPRSILEQARQKQTIADIRNLGTALMSWLTDEVAGAAVGGVALRQDPQWYSTDLRLLSHEQLVTMLHPNETFYYIQEVPEHDGWGNPLEVRLDENLLEVRVMSIRSPGADGVFEGSEYMVGSFPESEVDNDIVWADGFFVRWPETPARRTGP